MKGKPIPVRLSDEQIARLDVATRRMGLENRSDIIKLCLNSFLDCFDKHQTACLPLDWPRILANLDGRSNRYHVENNGGVVNVNGSQVLKVAESRKPYLTSRGSRRQKLDHC